jgi:general secretion pathway protein E
VADATSSRTILAALIPATDFARAQTLATQRGEPIDAVCTRLGLCSENDVVAALCRTLGLPRITPPDLPATAWQGATLNPNFLRTARVCPVDEADGVLRVAMVDPTDSATLQALASAKNDEQDQERLTDLASDAPVIRYVNQIVARAIDLRASDIHLEPVGHNYQLRFRLDGMLQKIEEQPAHFGEATVSRIKIMARLNIAERRLAQDGRFRVSARGQEVDLRVATTPTVHGEAVVLNEVALKRVESSLSTESGEKLAQNLVGVIIPSLPGQAQKLHNRIEEIVAGGEGSGWQVGDATISFQRLRLANLDDWYFDLTLSG